jgi:hypothetical protein
MKLSKLLKFQLAYGSMGLAYNVISYIVMLSGGRQLSTTDPLTGGATMALYGAFLLTAYFDSIRIYRALMLASIIVFGYGGIAVHFIKYFRDPSQYASFVAWALAVGINIFGLYFNVLAAMGRFEGTVRGASPGK